MRLPIAIGAAAAALSSLGAIAAPQPAAPARPLATLYDAPGITRACEQGIARAQATVKRMEAKKGAGAIFDEWNRLQMAMEDFVNPIYLLGSVHPDKAVRDASEPCLQKYTTLSTELLQNEKLFKRVKAAKPANPHQAKLKKDLIEGFEDQPRSDQHPVADRGVGQQDERRPS